MPDYFETRSCPAICSCTRMFFLKVIILFLVFFPPDSKAHALGKSTIGVGIGFAGILDHDKIIMGSIEFRPNLEYLKLRPWSGMEFGYDLIYLAAGILYRIPFTEKLMLIPSFGAGFYSSQESIELGHQLEFRTAVELNYTFHNKTALGIHFGHISNGGLSKKNPGSEILKIIYYISF
jgi:hypothetical protein